MGTYEDPSLTWPDGKQYSVGGVRVAPPVEGVELTKEQLAVEAHVRARLDREKAEAEAAKAEAERQDRLRVANQQRRDRGRSTRRRARGKLTTADRRLFVDVGKLLQRNDSILVRLRDVARLSGGRPTFDAVAEQMGWLVAEEGDGQHVRVRERAKVEAAEAKVAEAQRDSEAQQRGCTESDPCCNRRLAGADVQDCSCECHVDPATCDGCSGMVDRGDTTCRARCASGRCTCDPDGP